MPRPVKTPGPALDLPGIQAWNRYWAEIARRIGAAFARAETRPRALADLAGLLSPAERKNSWQLAASSGDQRPSGLQPLLGQAEGAPEVLRDRLRIEVPDYLRAPDAGGVSDDTGFLKQGPHSAGAGPPERGRNPPAVLAARGGGRTEGDAHPPGVVVAPVAPRLGTRLSLPAAAGAGAPSAPAHRTGRPVAYDRRQGVEAMGYGMQSDGAGRPVSSRFPPWQTVDAPLRRWRATGRWDKMWVGLDQPHPSG
jgi:hypothetical protein